MVDLDQGQRVEEVVEELQESDLEEEPVGWHSINFLVFVIVITTSWTLSSIVS